MMSSIDGFHEAQARKMSKPLQRNWSRTMMRQDQCCTSAAGAQLRVISMTFGITNEQLNKVKAGQKPFPELRN